LNTYLRNANPPVFSSRTCRIASILEHRHPLKDPSQPEHATKNRPDRDQPADLARGQRYVEEFGLANARDVIKMVRWNDKYGIKFMRLSSEMFPFASHDEYGYKLAPFAADTLAEVGRIIGELGHRVTTHPGQFTQLGSPRKQVIDNAIRDLAYHDELLSLLKLPPQQDRDAVMILHLGGAYGDKPAAIERFKENYAKLPQSVKNRLVLENDDVVWAVHEILPLCEELNIPMVLDFHHHNILFDSTQIREGTKDIVELYPRILETWRKKSITPKMHYSEPCPEAVTARTRRKHSPRVMTLPPCPDTMDLMIEAKDKEQAVFELMRTFKLPGFDLFNDIVPHVRQDENRPWKPKPKKVAKKSKKKKTDELEELDVKMEEEEEEKPPPVVPEEEVGMGGPERRVYWPPGMEDWLRPAKRIVKKKEDADGAATPAKKKIKTAAACAANTDDVSAINGDTPAAKKTPVKKPAPKRAPTKQKAAGKAVPTPSPSDEDSDPLSSLGEDEDGVEGGDALPMKGAAARAPATRKKSGRVSQRVSYKEEEADD
jgi:UV DNA damage endonuclease